MVDVPVGDDDQLKFPGKQPVLISAFSRAARLLRIPLSTRIKHRRFSPGSNSRTKANRGKFPQAFSIPFAYFTGKDYSLVWHWRWPKSKPNEVLNGLLRTRRRIQAEDTLGRKHLCLAKSTQNANIHRAHLVCRRRIIAFLGCARQL